MKRSMPRISAIPATGTLGTTANVAASVMNPAPVTPRRALAGDDRHTEQGKLLAQ